MRILGDDEAFGILERRFSELRPYDVIDLCHDDSRFPAVVTEIDHTARRFHVIPLTRNNLMSLLGDGVIPLTIEVAVPDNSMTKRSMWNKVGN